MTDDKLTKRKVLDTYARSKNAISAMHGNLYWPWENITEIDDGAFSGYDFLEKAELPHEIEYLGRRAFAGCVNLKNIKLSEKMRGFWADSFDGCDKLETLYLPDSIEWIYGDIFSYCHSLKHLNGGKNLRFIFVENNSLQTAKLPKSFKGQIINLKENPEAFKSLPTNLFWEYHLTKFLYNDIQDRLKEKINSCEIKDEKKQLENLLNTITYKIYSETLNLCSQVQQRNHEKCLKGLEESKKRKKEASEEGPVLK